MKKLGYFFAGMFFISGLALAVTYPPTGGGDPLIPGDGTQNITGGLVVSGDATISTITLDNNDSVAGGPAIVGPANADIVIRPNGGTYGAILTNGDYTSYIGVDNNGSDDILLSHAGGNSITISTTDIQFAGTPIFSTAIPATSGGTGLSALGTANQQLRVNGAGNALEYFTPAAAGIGGSTGATDNAILVADGTGGATLQARDITIADVASNVLLMRVTGTDAVHIFGDISAATATASVGAIEVGAGDDLGTGDTVFLVADANDTTPVKQFSVDGVGDTIITGDLSIVGGDLDLTSASGSEFACSDGLCNFTGDVDIAGGDLDFTGASGSEIDCNGDCNIADTLILPASDSIDVTGVLAMNGSTGVTLQFGATTYFQLSSGRLIHHRTLNYDPGAFSPAGPTNTLTPMGSGGKSYFVITPSGASDITIAETSASAGDMIVIEAEGANAPTILDIDGQVELVGDANYVMGDMDTLTLIYSSTQSAWVELARSVN